jgi:hypothetical protein
VEEAICIAARSAFETVFEKLRFFVIRNEQGFRSELDTLFKDWADFWLKMQYSEEQLEATLEDEYPDSPDAWKSSKDFGNESQTPGTESRSVPLFPCIYSAMTEKVIQAGWFLYLDQELVVSAKKEAEDMARPKNNVGRGHSRRKSENMFPSGTLSNIGRGATLAHSATWTPSPEGSSSVLTPRPNVGLKYSNLDCIISNPLQSVGHLTVNPAI